MQLFYLIFGERETIHLLQGISLAGIQLRRGQQKYSPLRLRASFAYVEALSEDS
jgi:hypothetical protein